METTKNTTSMNALFALFRLVMRLLKEQKGMLIGFGILIIVIMFLPLIVFKDEELATASEMSRVVSFFTWSAWMPSLLITLVILPMVHQQIFSSSILKRLKSSGISSTQYGLVMIGSFSIASIVSFWTLAILTQTLYVIVFSSFDFHINWFTFIFVTPIIWVSFASTGILIGNFKIPEIVKGIIIFFIIAIIVIMSMTVLNPENMDSDLIGGEKLKLAFLTINPWALMINVVNGSMIAGEEGLFVILSIVVSILLTVNLFLIAINRISLKK